MSIATSSISRVFDPVAEVLTPELAKKLVELKFDATMQMRLDYLRQGANAGTLTPDEDSEYKRIVDAIDLISILQLKARRFLNDLDH